ncbi:zinc ribbon domain-containing protein [Cohnella luojiensis]|uniref:PEGA domain-containing protein n=1 Tax=Cohnella luojiensis TaxID=652876 RepID=A0A4Y8LSQ6_9BACL|nr:hypothetical protein [Cohnella luojiensis]TFE19703.1 hypothetical protein E2980_22400 [Cohnella luojiensis]
MLREYAFCPECGTPVVPNEISATIAPDMQPYASGQPTAVPPIVHPANPAVALSKKAKILIASGVVVILLLVGVYFLGKYLTDEQRLLDRFESAIEDGKADKLFDMLSASNSDTPFDQKTVDGIVKYLGSNKESLLTVMEQLKAEAKQLEAGDAETFANDADAAFLYLNMKNKKRWLIYNDYELKVKRYMIPVQTNFEGAKILVNGQEAATASGDGSSIEVGPFLPGEYEIKSVYEGEYTTLENKETVSLFPMASYEDSVKLVLEGDYVHVYSNYSNSRIFINGKDIGLAVEDGKEIGPIAIDGSNKMYVETEFPWGEIKSEEFAVDTDQLEFNVSELNDAMKEEIMSSAYDFVTSWMAAFQARDINALRHVHSDRVADFTEYFTDMVDSDEYYMGELHRITFDLDGFDVNQYSESEYTVSVKAQVDYSEIFYYSEYETDPVPVAGTNYTEYVLQYVDGQWLVSGWSPSYDVGTENTKVYE